jgi:hypothetical protein
MEEKNLSVLGFYHNIKEKEIEDNEIKAIKSTDLIGALDKRISEKFKEEKNNQKIFQEALYKKINELEKEYTNILVAENKRNLLMSKSILDRISKIEEKINTLKK